MDPVANPSTAFRPSLLRFLISVASDEHYWLQEAKLLSLSDIGMIVKQDKDNMYVFCNSIRDATAMSNVRVNFVSTNNQVLYTADAWPGRIYKLSLDGKVLGMLGRAGRQPKQFGWIHGMACPSENELYVAEVINWRVQKLLLHPAAGAGSR